MVCLWFSTTLDIEEVLTGTGSDQLHVMIADVIESFDTVDRSILDCSLGRLGLPSWFRKVYFSYHSQVLLRFKVAALGAGWLLLVPFAKGFKVKLEAPSSFDAFRAAIIRSVWFCEMPLAHTPAILDLLDGPVGVDRAYHII